MSPFVLTNGVVGSQSVLRLRPNELATQPGQWTLVLEPMTGEL